MQYIKDGTIEGYILEPGDSGYESRASRIEWLKAIGGGMVLGGLVVYLAMKLFA